MVTPNVADSLKNDFIDVNILPKHTEVVVAGFSQSFIDANWEEIKNSEEIQSWMLGIANQIPYLRPLAVPGTDGGTLKEKKARINKVVILIISALWNNWCNFGDKGGVKARNATNDYVPALHTSVAHFLFQTLQSKLRSMRGTSSRKGRRGKKIKGEYDDVSSGSGNDGQGDEGSSSEEEDNDRAVTSKSKKPAPAEAKKRKKSSQKQKISEEERQKIAQIEQEKIWEEEAKAEDEYQSAAQERYRLREEAAALARVVVETPGMKEQRLAKEAAEALELKRKRENSVTVKLPNEAKKKTTRKKADEYEKIYGTSIYPDKRESPRKKGRTEESGSSSNQVVPQVVPRTKRNSRI